MEKLDIVPIIMESDKGCTVKANNNGNNMWRTNKGTKFELIIHPDGGVQQNWKAKKLVNSHLEIHPIVCKFVSDEFTN